MIKHIVYFRSRLFGAVQTIVVEIKCGFEIAEQQEYLNYHSTLIFQFSDSFSLFISFQFRLSVISNPRYKQLKYGLTASFPVTTSGNFCAKRSFSFVLQ